ncbi:hypothetical protein GCM10010195_54920 [Kitasatospora griseola]|nr:hypothetical protein GCM10010195_54920 [Kitasatospora griseola]
MGADGGTHQPDCVARFLTERQFAFKRRSDEDDGAAEARRQSAVRGGGGQAERPGRRTARGPKTWSPGGEGAAVLTRCGAPAEAANAELPAPLAPDEQAQLTALPTRFHEA